MKKSKLVHLKPEIRNNLICTLSDKLCEVYSHKEDEPVNYNFAENLEYSIEFIIYNN